MKENKKFEKKQKDIKKLYRSKNNKVLAGIAGGLGEYLEVDPLVFRLLFIIFSVFGGSGIIIYILLWIFIPTEDNINSSSEDTMKNNIEEIKEKAESFSSKLEGSNNKKSGKYILGTFLFILGVLLLLQNFGYIQILHFFKLWPLLIIAIALAILF